MNSRDDYRLLTFKQYVFYLIGDEWDEGLEQTQGEDKEEGVTYHTCKKVHRKTVSVNVIVNR